MRFSTQKTCTFLFAVLLLLGASLTPVQAQMQKVSYDLKAQSNDGVIPDGVDATATFWELNEFQTLVTLELDEGNTGLDAVHPAHLHNGDADVGGGLEMYLTPIDGSRDSTSARIIDIPFDSLRAFDGYISIYESVETLENDIARGNIGANADKTAEEGLDVVENPRVSRFDLAANPNDGALPNGMSGEATFTEVTGDKTLVTLNLDADGSTSKRGGVSPHASESAPTEESRDFFFFASADPQIDMTGSGVTGIDKMVTTMNQTPGKDWPFGGQVDTPKGTLIAGDMVEDVDNGDNWEAYKSYYDPNPSEEEAELNFPVFEGTGNHDLQGDNGRAMSNVEEAFVERNKRHPADLNLGPENYHYSWDWEGIHFVNLNVFPGNEPRPVYGGDAPWNNPRNSLEFLKRDLAQHVGHTDQPIVLMWHYGLRGWGLNQWWTEKDLDNLAEALDGYNVALIIHGHEHRWDHYQWEGYEVIMAPSPKSGNDAKGFVTLRATEDSLQVAHHDANGWQQRFYTPLEGGGEENVSSYPAYIHTGDTGSIEYGLGPIDGSDPRLRSSKLVNESYDTLMDFDGYVNVHESVGNLGTVVSQGEIGANAEPVPVSIAEARAETPKTSLYGHEATIRGSVSRAFGSYVRIQGNSGPPEGDGPSGVTIRQVDGPLSEDFQADIADGNIQAGTELEVTGATSHFNGLIQIDGDDLSSYEIVEKTGTEPTPEKVSLSDLQGPSGENYESVLVQVDNLIFPDASGTFESNTTYTVVGGGGFGTSYDFRVQQDEETNLIGASIPSVPFTYEGVVGQFNSESSDPGGRDVNSGYRLIPIQSETALPVELTSFNAVETGSSVALTWQTASETNNAGFRVQHETESGWTSLGFVGSKASGGTTTEGISYRYTVDQDLDPGTHRFRLEQKDLDGSTSTSEVVTVDVGMDEALMLKAPAPNPTSSATTLKFGVKTQMEVTVSVYNALGQRVKTIYQGAPQAEQMHDVTVDASTLPSGVYVVRLKAGGQNQTERLTVVR